MRSFKWQALFAAAMLAVPTLALAQSADDAKPEPKAAIKLDGKLIRVQSDDDSKPGPQPEIRLDQKLNLNEDQNVNLNQIQIEEDDKDPFYAAPDAPPRPKRVQTIRVEPRVSVRPDRKTMVYTTKTMQFGRLTDSMGLSISNVPPAMAAQLRLEPGVGVVVEQIAPGSAIESAGIEQYDVIEKVDGHKIHQVQELTNSLRNAKSDSVSVDIVRQAHRKTLSVDRNQIRQSKAFTFNRGERSGGAAGGGMAFEFQPKANKQGQVEADNQRDQADRERDKADRDREKADRNRQRDLDHAQRDRDRQGAKREQQSMERDQLNAMREQIKSTLDRERGELDKAREQLNHATQEMNQRLNELRVKLDTEVRQKMEQELRKGQDQIREKMQMLEQQTRDLQTDDKKADDKNEKN